MTRQRLLKLGTLTAGVICLMAGYGLAGRWGLLAAAGLVWLMGILTDGWSTVVFVVLVGLAMGGISIGVWPLPMIFGATLALASWDLANWENFVAGGLPDETTAWLERRHHIYLALALGSGLLISIIGQMITFQIPFGVLVLLIVLVLFGVDQIWRLVKG